MFRKGIAKGIPRIYCVNCRPLTFLTNSLGPTRLCLQCGEKAQSTTSTLYKHTFKLVGILDPTSNVYFIVLCSENAINDTSTVLN